MNNIIEIKPIITKQNISKIELQWNNIDNCDVFKVIRMLKNNKEITEYWGTKTNCNIINLDENFCHKFQIFALKFIEPKYSTINSSDIIRACTLPNIPTTISLQRAIKKSQEYLLKRYSKIKPELLNIPGPNGLTPLATAVTLGDRDLIEIILNSNPNINFGCPIIGRTPLHLSMFYGFIAIAKLLIDQKADKHRKDINGLTYGHYAIDGGHIEAVKFVLVNGVNVEEKDSCGWTLLLRAVAITSHIDIIKLLLQYNCNVNAIDVNNQNAIQLATISNQMDICELLNSQSNI